jgi:hypothetical protein
VSANRSRQRVRPLPTGSTRYTPAASASAARRAVERRSARPMLYLYQLPRWVPAVTLVILLVVGLAVPGPGGAAALCALAAVLGWLAAVSWPRLTVGGRVGRLLAVGVFLAYAAYQATR